MGAVVGSVSTDFGKCSVCVAKGVVSSVVRVRVYPQSDSDVRKKEIIKSMSSKSCSIVTPTVPFCSWDDDDGAFECRCSSRSLTDDEKIP